MKKVIFALTMMLMLGTTAQATQQSHRHTPRTEQKDSVAPQQQDAIEAYSDTTSQVDSTVVYSGNHSITLDDEDVKDITKSVLDEVFGGHVIGDMITALLIVFCIFVLAPVLILFVILYFIHKNRKDRLKIAEMAMKNGQPIPDQLLKEQLKSEDADSYQSGIRQLFLGLGLMFFLGYAAGKIGVGIGALVFFIGLGKVVIAKTTGKKDNDPIDNYPIEH